MAVLTVVTRDSLPPQLHPDMKQQYMLDLEKALITHFNNDPRLGNKTTWPGRLEGGKAIGYVVYLAMKFSDPTLVKVEDGECFDYKPPLSYKDPSTEDRKTHTPSFATASSTLCESPTGTRPNVKKRCKCGSDSHQRTNHGHCPLNKKR